MSRPTTWEQKCLQEALDSAGFQYVLLATEGEPELSFHFGPSLEAYVSLHVSVQLGGMRFVARSPEVARPPSGEWLRYANEVNIEWGLGRLYWNSERAAPELAATLFAHPDHIPPPEQIQELCRQLWMARHGLTLEVGDLPRFADKEDPTGPAWVADRFRAAGYPLEARPDGSYSQRFDTGDEGTCLVRVLMERPGVVFIDALSAACPEWPEHPELLWKLHALNCRHSAVAVTRWSRKVVVRRALPTAWIPMHPEWVPLTLAQLSRACVDLARTGRELLDPQEEML